MIKSGKRLLLFLIDCSGSLDGAYISAINASMWEILELFQSISSNNSENSFMTGAIVFSDQANWLGKNKLFALDDFQWENLSAGKTSEFGKALELAIEVLDEDVLEQFGCTAELKPIIVYVGDGCPTDRYGESLRKVKENSIFNRSVKLALYTGAMIDREMLISFTGDLDTLIPLNDIESIKKFVV